MFSPSVIDLTLVDLPGVTKVALPGKTTLETSGEDVKLHSKRVGRCETTLEKSGKDAKLHSGRVEKM